MADQPRNPLHGITLETIVTELVEHYGWPALGEQVTIRCFTTDPSIASSLKFLRRTPWAREKVESLYLFAKRSGGTPDTGGEFANPRKLGIAQRERTRQARKGRE